MWNVTTGYTENFPSNNGYSIEVIFPTNASHPIEIKQYADIALYDALWNIATASVGGNLMQTASIFNAIQTECADYGCADAGYFSPGVPSTVVYSLYKIALDLIVYKELLASGTFSSINSALVNETVNHLFYVANQLQSQMAECTFKYNAYGDNIVPFGLDPIHRKTGRRPRSFCSRTNCGILGI